MKYYTICFPGEYGQHIQETWSTEQILNSFYGSWSGQMESMGKDDEITEENCIEDWITAHWAEETDKWGNKIV